MKAIALTLGCATVILFTAGVSLLSAVLLLNQPWNTKFTGTLANRGKIGVFTPAPISVTPLPVVSFLTATPVVSGAKTLSTALTAASTVTAAQAGVTTVITATVTPTASANIAVSQASVAASAASTTSTSAAETASASASASTGLTTVPTRQPDAMGRFKQRSGDTIVINTGPESGSTVKVVVTDSTAIYRDTSEMPQPGGGNPGAAGKMSPPGGGGDKFGPGAGGPPPGGTPAAAGAAPTMQLKVEKVDSLPEISGQAMILAWGEQQDNQLVAQVLVYHLAE